MLVEPIDDLMSDLDSVNFMQDLMPCTRIKINVERFDRTLNPVNKLGQILLLIMDWVLIPRDQIDRQFPQPGIDGLLPMSGFSRKEPEKTGCVGSNPQRAS